MDDVEKRKFFTLPGLELQPLGRPASSQSLYRLSYPGSSLLFGKVKGKVIPVQVVEALRVARG
jgi:hypothetical protein